MVNVLLENCGFIHKPLVKKEVIEFDNIKCYVPIIKRASSENLRVNGYINGPKD